MDNLKKKTKELTAFNVRVIEFKYLCPTNTKGSRVKIKDPRFKTSVTIPFGYEYSSAGAVAVSYLLAKGWPVGGVNEDAGIIIMSEWDAAHQL